MSQILEFPPGHSTLLPIIERCDNGSLAGDGTADQGEERLVPFFLEELSKQPIGYLRASVVQALLQDNVERVSKSAFYEICWKMMRSDASDNDTGTMNAPDIVGVAFAEFAEWINVAGSDTRTEHVNRVTTKWRSAGLFQEELKGTVHAPTLPFTYPY